MEPLLETLYRANLMKLDPKFFEGNACRPCRLKNKDWSVVEHDSLRLIGIALNKVGNFCFSNVLTLLFLLLTQLFVSVDSTLRIQIIITYLVNFLSQFVTWILSVDFLHSLL